MDKLEFRAHKKRHVKLHKYFEELLADYIEHHKEPFDETTTMDLLKWSRRQTINPEEHTENQ